MTLYISYSRAFLIGSDIFRTAYRLTSQLALTQDSMWDTWRPGYIFHSLGRRIGTHVSDLISSTSNTLYILCSSFRALRLVLIFFLYSITRLISPNAGGSMRDWSTYFFIRWVDICSSLLQFSITTSIQFPLISELGRIYLATWVWGD
jgi:hypothetical protein